MESKKEEIYDVQELDKIQETSDKIQEFKETSDRIQETSEQNRKISMLFFDEFLKLITGNKFKRDLIESIKIDIENNLNIEIIFSNIIDRISNLLSGNVDVDDLYSTIKLKEINSYKWDFFCAKVFLLNSSIQYQSGYKLKYIVIKTDRFDCDLGLRMRDINEWKNNPSREEIDYEYYVVRSRVMLSILYSDFINRIRTFIENPKKYSDIILSFLERLRSIKKIPIKHNKKISIKHNKKCEILFDIKFKRVNSFLQTHGFNNFSKDYVQKINDDIENNLNIELILSNNYTNLMNLLNGNVYTDDLVEYIELRNVDSYKCDFFYAKVFLLNSPIQYEKGTILKYIVVKTNKSNRNIGLKMRDYYEWKNNPNREDIDYEYYFKYLIINMTFLFSNYALKDDNNIVLNISDNLEIPDIYKEKFNKMQYNLRNFIIDYNYRRSI